MCLWQNMVCSLWHFMTNFFILAILPALGNLIAFFSEFKTLTFQYCCWSGPLKSEVWCRRFRIWRIILKVLVFTVCCIRYNRNTSHASGSGGRYRKICAPGLTSQMSSFSNSLREQKLDRHRPFFVMQGDRIPFFTLKDNLPYLGMNWNPWNKRSKFDTDYKPISVICKCLCLPLKPYKETELFLSI